MGNDGGSIPTRRELVKNAARNPNNTEVKATQLESQTHAWTYCPLSQRPLAPPIVSDCAGILYNKDAVLEYLLPSDEPSTNTIKTEHEEALATRIRSLRDVIEVKFQTEKDDSARGAMFICPITTKELGPQAKAVYFAPCGHAFAEMAIKQVAGDTCLQCSENYTLENIITILPAAKEDISRLAKRIQQLRETGLTHSLRKAPGGKKRKKLANKEASESTANRVIEGKSELRETDETKTVETETADMPHEGGASTPQSKSGRATPSGGIKNAATASLTAKVLDEQEEKNKRRKLGLNDNLKSLFFEGGSAENPSDECRLYDERLLDPQEDVKALVDTKEL